MSSDSTDFEFILGEAAETALQPEQERARWKMLAAIERGAPWVLRDLADAPLAAYRAFEEECQRGPSAEEIEAFLAASRAASGPLPVAVATSLPWLEAVREWMRRWNLEAPWIGRYACDTLTVWAASPGIPEGTDLRWARPRTVSDWHYPPLPRVELPRIDGPFSSFKEAVQAQTRAYINAARQAEREALNHPKRRRPDLRGIGIEDWVYAAFVRYQVPQLASGRGEAKHRLVDDQLIPDRYRKAGMDSEWLGDRLASLVSLTDGPALRREPSGRPRKGR